MTQLGEMVKVGMITSKDATCPFHDKGHECSPKVKNDLDGNATTLGVNLNSGGDPSSTVVRKSSPDIRYRRPVQEDDPDALTELQREVELISGDPNSTIPVAFAAHHLIPAKESLDRAESLKKYIKKSGGTICCDLGYDVNGSENGVWLPGLHAVNRKGLNLWKAGDDELPADEDVGANIRSRKELEDRSTKWTYTLLDGPRPTDGKPASEVFSSRNLKWLYVKASMEYLPKKRQFHDRHPAYSAQVKANLEAIGKLLDHFRGSKRDAKLPGCDQCKDQKKDDIPPPIRLLGILNRMSAWYRTQVLGRTTHKVYYTSSWCRVPRGNVKVVKRKTGR